MTTTTTAAVYDNRTAFADELISLARRDERVVAVCNDSVGSSNLVAFREEFPDRLINVGIAEQNMVGVGAGLANAGLIPFVCGAGPFLTGRALEQIKADVAYSAHNVVLCGMSPGMAYGELGPTHHSLEDISWLRAIPGLDIVLPVDRDQTRQVLRGLVETPRPTYVRVGRFKVPDLPEAPEALQYGRIQLVRDGSDVALLAAGTMVSRALDAADLLAREGISARVLNAAYVAPFDAETVVAAAHDCGAVVTAEEANSAGGLGAAVAEVLGQHDDKSRVPLRVLGTREFAPTGSTTWLLDYFGLTAEGVAKAARDVIGRV